MLQRRKTVLIIRREVAAPLGRRDKASIGVVVGVVDVCFFLDGGIDPSVVDSEGCEVDGFCIGEGAVLDTGVLGDDVVGEFGAVVASV